MDTKSCMRCKLTGANLTNADLDYVIMDGTVFLTPQWLMRKSYQGTDGVQPHTAYCLQVNIGVLLFTNLEYTKIRSKLLIFIIYLKQVIGLLSCPHTELNCRANDRFIMRVFF